MPEITKDSLEYPKLLAKVRRPPEELYAKGNLVSDSLDKCVAVVGSRRMTTYGREIVGHLLQDFISQNICVVSGFMYGVDAYVHETCIKYGIRTCAVMPCGVDVIHPAYQKDLYTSILDSGGYILSEYPDETPPQIWMYPCRNRIVAGVSLATVVVEAAEGSGSLITANYAKTFGRPVFVVPANIFAENYKGIDSLIKGGAHVVSSGKDILQDLNLYSDKGAEGSLFSSLSLTDTLSQEIYTIVRSEPATIDSLCQETGETSCEITNALTSMLIQGYLKESAGRFYVS